MIHSIAMRRFALVCAIFILTGISSVFGQTLTETIESTPVSIIPQVDGLTTLVPCGGEYVYVIHVTITDLSPETDYILEYSNWFEPTGLRPFNSGTDESETFDITIELTEYSPSITNTSTAYTLTQAGEVVALNVITQPYMVNNPSYQLNTKYYEGVVTDLSQAIEIEAGTGSCIPDDGEDHTNTACLYYKNANHVFSRITIIRTEENSPTPNSLTLIYTPEDEINLQALKIQCIDGNSDCAEFTPTVPSNGSPTSITLTPELVQHLAAGNAIRVVEEFAIQDCGSVQEIPVTQLSLVPCIGIDFVQNYTMNVLVNSSGSPITYCFNIEDGGVDIEGIPLFDENDFDIRFTFTNPTEDGAGDNTGHKELGWIVLPIDLKPLIPEYESSWSIVDVNNWLNHHTVLQFDPIQNHTAINCALMSSDTLNVPDGFARVYEPSLAYDDDAMGVCSSPPLDPLRRIVLDFSTLSHANLQSLAAAGAAFFENSVLTNWYSDGEGEGENSEVWNTFMQGTCFSLIFTDMVFDNTQFESVNNELDVINQNEIITDYNFMNKCETGESCNFSCGNSGFSLFKIPNVDYLGHNYFYRQFYSVSKDMCDRLAMGSSPMPILQKLVGAETCPQWNENTSNSLLSPLELDYSYDLEYRGNIVDIFPEAEPASILNQGEHFEVEFQYGMYDANGQDEAILANNQWSYGQGGFEPLFDCTNQETRGRISIPLALAHRCDISVMYNQNQDNCDGIGDSSPILDYNLYGADMIEGCTDVYIIDENTGERKPLVDANEDIAQCSMDKMFYVDFNLAQLADDPNNDFCKKIIVRADWTYTGSAADEYNALSCPTICDCGACSHEGVQYDKIRMTIYTLCRESGDDCSPIDLDVDDSENDEIYIHKLKCSEQEIQYVCGPRCDTYYHCYSDQGFNAYQKCSPANGNYLSVIFNTHVSVNNVNPFKMNRSTFGYHIPAYTENVDQDGDGNPDSPENADGSFDVDDDTDGDFYRDEALTFNQANGFTMDDILGGQSYNEFVATDGDPETEMTNESLTNFLPGDKIDIEAKGTYYAYYGDSDCNELSGNALLTYVIQTEMDQSIFYQLPCVPGENLENYEISLTFTRGNLERIFHATDFQILNCVNMENLEDPSDTRTTLVFVFEDFYNGNCGDGTLIYNTSPDGIDPWEVTFKGFVFMNPNPKDLAPQSHLDEIIKGSFALLDPEDLEYGNYCPGVYSCDNNTTVGNYHELQANYDFILESSHDIITSCTRPYHLEISYNANEDAGLFNAYGDEYRPIFGINRVDFLSLESEEYLDLDHRYWGNPQYGAGLWYINRPATHTNTAVRNFYSRLSEDEDGAIFNDHHVSITPTLMGMPQLNKLNQSSNYFAARTIYGTAEVKTPQFVYGVESQQIGESAVDVDVPETFKQLMQCNAISVDYEVDYYLDDDITEYLEDLVEEGVCETDIDAIVTPPTLGGRTDLKNNRVGFASGLTQSNEIVSQTGTFRSADIDYLTFSAPAASTSSFFVTIENIDGITFNDVTLIKEVNNTSTGYNIDEEVEYHSVDQETDGVSTTFYFHQDLYYQDDQGKDPYFTATRYKDQMFLPRNGGWQLNWYLKFDYTLDNNNYCYELEDNSDEPLDIFYYYGEACAWHEPNGDIDELHFRKCQTCISMNPNCPDCADCGTPSVDCIDDAQAVDTDGVIINLTDDNSLVNEWQEIRQFPDQQYHTGYDGFVGQFTAVWGNESLYADITLSPNCDQTICVNLVNGDENDDYVMDAEIVSITVQYPNSWPAIQVNDLAVPNGMVAGTSIAYAPSGNDIIATITFTSNIQNSNPVLHAEQSLAICFQFANWTSNSLPPGECYIEVNAKTICGNDMWVTNGNALFELFEDFNFSLSFNETLASCLNGVVQNDGSVDIVPHITSDYTYEWTTFPDGFQSTPFTANPTNMPVGFYVLTVTNIETGCALNYEVEIESVPCCNSSNSTLSGTLILDETNPCIPRLCGSITGQTGFMESITISYPPLWLDPVLVSSSCPLCLAAADYSVAGAVTLIFNSNYQVTDQVSFDFCFDFDLIDPLIWESAFGISTADLVMNFNYNTLCGETETGLSQTAVWDVPNPSLTSSLVMSIENCNPLACLTYTNDGDQTVFITSIALSPYFYGTPDVTGDCIGCTFTPILIGGNMALIPADLSTTGQLQLAPGETLDLCIAIPIEDPENYQNFATQLNVTTAYAWSCGSNLSDDYPISSGTFQFYQNPNFSISFNETMATCTGGSVDGSVNIQPYEPESFLYTWTTFPNGFDYDPFVHNPTNMPVGAYVLTVTEIETGCQISYHLLIESEECCEITLSESDYDDCLAKYKFSIDSECESPNISVEVLDPNGAPVPFLEDFWAGILDVSFETTIEGEYTIEIVVSCGAENPCGALSVGVISTPECSSAVVPNCFAIWDDEVVNNFRMEGNAVISHANSNSYSVLGSAHNAANDELNYYWQHLDLAGNNISNQAFGNDALTTSTDEYVLDAVEHNGYIYNVGYGLYDDGNGMHECLMISKIDLANGSLSASKRYSLSNSSNERATCIDTYVNSNGETQLIVAGYTDLDVSRGVNAFATSFSLSLDLTSEFFLYDVNSRDNFMYEVKNISQASVFVLVGKGMIEPSIFGASALMLDYNFNIVDEFTFYKRPSEITSVGFDGNDLYFAGNYIEDVEENIAKAMIFKTGLSWGPYISFTTLENTDDNEAFDWARDLVIHNSDIYIAGQSGLGGTKGLLIKVDPGEGELEDEFQVVWSKQTTTKHTTLKAITDVLNPDGSSGIIAVGDTQSEGEDAIAVVHSDLEGNTCCLETTTVIPDQIEVQLTNGYMRGTKTPFPTDLLTGSTNFADLPMCDPLIKSAQVGLKVSTPDASLHVIPNPNDGQFELILSSAEAWLTEVVVIDVTGQVIFKSNYPTKDQLRSLSIGSDLELNAGMYLVQVRLSNGEEMSTRVVVGRQ